MRRPRSDLEPPSPASSAFPPQRFVVAILPEPSGKEIAEPSGFPKESCRCERRGEDAISSPGRATEATMPVLQDKAVLVTGAGAGIGRATALAMAAEGAVVAAADIDLAAAERTAAQAAGNSRRALA